MEFAFNEDQLELQKAARRFFESHSDPMQVRKASEPKTASSAGYDVEVWRRVSEELLWPGLAFPEEYGGYGFSFLELAPILEEMGRALFVSPFFASVCLAGPLVLEAGDEAQKKALIPEIAGGTMVATLAHVEPGKTWDDPGNTTSISYDADGAYISGTKRYVLWGQAADLLIVSAYDDDGVLTLVAVSRHSDGVTVKPLPTMDLTRPQAEITFKSVLVDKLEGADGILSSGDAAREALAKALNYAEVALACEQVGAAEACLEMAVEYAKTRKQFGKAIGAFQAIKHKCANMMLYVESARSAAYFAAWAAARSPDDELAEAASVAQAYCSDALFRCASDNIQIHGGIGITWECDAQLYFKRAKASETLLAPASVHRERVLEIVLNR